MPSRIQRSRAKGWRMPEGAVYVGRPSRWGNPFDLAVIHHAAAVALVEHGDLVGKRPSHDALGSYEWVESCHRLRQADAPAFAAWLAPLAGKDLACFCTLDRPCHADVLLELANRDA